MLHKKTDNVGSIYGIPVKCVDMIEDISNSYVIVAVMGDASKQIYKNLIEKYICQKEKIYVISFDEYLHIRKLVPDLIYEVRNELKSLSDIVKRDVKYIIPNKKDKERYSKEFGILIQNKEILTERIFALTKDLDEDSRFEVCRILDRLHKLIEGKTICFSKQEFEDLSNRKFEYEQNIFKLSDDIYYARGFYFPNNKPSFSGFFDEEWVKLIYNLDYINNKDVIDAGAFIGDTPLIFSKYTNGHIHSFDADEQNYKILQRTAQLNPDKRIVPVYYALTDFNGEVKFSLGCGRDTGSEKECGNGVGSIQQVNNVNKSNIIVSVPAITIDKYVSDNNLKIGLIKADVEGAEQQMLLGAEQTIRSQKPILYISIYHSIDDFFNIKTWIESLDLNYKFKIHRTVVAHSFMEETMLLCLPE